jgi:PAS domain S-box-containing protein
MCTHRFSAPAGSAFQELSIGLPFPAGGRALHVAGAGESVPACQAGARVRAPDTSEARLRAMIEAAPDCVLVVGRDGRMTEINPAGLELFDAESWQELAGRPLAEFVEGEQREAFEACVEGLWRGEKGEAEFESISRSGKRRWIEMHAAPIRDGDGNILSYLGMLRDNTARRELKKQLIQAQKMEVVGHLAGGVAHDFNNMLAIILGYTEMLMEGMEAGSIQYEQAEAVFHTAERGAALTHQLLIFSRKETPRPQVVDLSELIVKIDPMLRRLIGENINLVTLPEPEVCPVKTDPSQIDQVLMNLTVNARDAMPNGGTITVETGNATIKERDPAHPNVAPGCYAVLSVTDTGAGMSEEVKAKIFEAFFTTKPAGRGTGLGLATCHGIVSHWRGHLEVESRLGAGSTFRVYLPCLPASAKAEISCKQPEPPPRGAETVLVVEDEPGLLALTSIVLQRQGYTVLKAANGREALGIVHDGSDEIDLVITDMVMPEMGGRIMADWLEAIQAGIRVLFTSGYTECSMDGEIDPEMEFIPKPYTPSDLLRKVREVIDRPQARKPAQSQGARKS